MINWKKKKKMHVHPLSFVMHCFHCKNCAATYWSKNLFVCSLISTGKTSHRELKKPFLDQNITDLIQLLKGIGEKNNSKVRVVTLNSFLLTFHANKSLWSVTWSVFSLMNGSTKDILEDFTIMMLLNPVSSFSEIMELNERKDLDINLWSKIKNFYESYFLWIYPRLLWKNFGNRC